MAGGTAGGVGRGIAGKMRFPAPEVKQSIVQLFDNTMPVDRDTLHNDHVAATYATLRRGMAVVAWFFPFVLLWFGNVFGIKLLDSMSAYYYQPVERGALDPWPAVWLAPLGVGSYLVYRFATQQGVSPLGYLKLFGAAAGYLIALYFLYRSETLEVMYNYHPMRTLFVGFLFVTGAFLVLYKGFTKRENLLLNIAGICAILVALFPTTDPACRVDGGRSDSPIAVGGPVCQEFDFPAPFGLDIAWHAVFAGGFFVGGALSIFFTAHQTLKDEWTGGLLKHKQSYKLFYRAMGVLMLAFPVVAWLLTETVGPNKYWIFWVETGGMLAFAAYWWVKSDEIKQTGADRRR